MSLLKIIAYEINEICSIGVAYVDMLAKYESGVKDLLFAVVVLLRCLRMVLMRRKSAHEPAKATEIIERFLAQNLWSNMGKVFCGAHEV